MRNLLGCRRGSAAIATVIALVPLIGVLALGGEAGSWYVIHQEAQNAADAAAYSGGLWLACNQAAACTDAETLAYRANEFAAQNGFCNAGDTTSYPGSRCQSLLSGTSQAVTIAVNGSQVQATVSQSQPTYLAKLVGVPTVTIGATAIAQVSKLSLPCVLTLQDPLSFQGSTTVNANCGVASNNTTTGAVSFTGNNGISLSAKSISALGGCSQTGGTQCSTVITYTNSPTPDPLSGLDSAIASLTTASFTGGTKGQCSTLTPYGPGADACYNNGWSPSGNVTLVSGVYFFDGAVTISGSVTITGTATLILLPKTTGKNSFSGGSLTINGNPTIQLTGLSSVASTQVPAALASVVSLMSDLVIYDPETTSKNKSVKLSGNSTNFFTGIAYFPNADVTYQGSTVSSTCTEVIAKGITLSGDSNFDNSGCPASVTGQNLETQYVRLVQ